MAQKFYVIETNRNHFFRTNCLETANQIFSQFSLDIALGKLIMPKNASVTMCCHDVDFPYKELYKDDDEYFIDVEDWYAKASIIKKAKNY